MKYGLIKVAAASPRIRVADTAFNSQAMVECAHRVAKENVGVLVFPELSMTAYTANDLLFSESLLAGAEQGVIDYMEQTKDLPLISFLGVPVSTFGRIYNCAAAICEGKLLGLVPKYALGNYGEFNESRWYARPMAQNLPLCYAGQETMIGTNLIFSCTSMPELKIAAEICEDIWVSEPISCRHTAAGANLIVNLCASDEFFGKSALRRDMTRVQSKRACCAYVLADAGDGESSTDLVFAGNHIMCSLGEVVAEKAPFSEGDTLIATLDLGTVHSRRLRANFSPDTTGYLYPAFTLPLQKTEIFPRPDAYPFIPKDGSGMETALAIQSHALASRMRHIHAKCAILGLSGGLDSTWAVIVAKKAVELLGMPASAVLAVTMPCFGTSSRTKNNAIALADALGVTLMEVNISQAVTQHLRDLGHDTVTPDLTFENAQARERTQVLMDLSNAKGGLVVGTGDLSEGALGWCTYNGDHMSLYSVNGSVPKTLMRHITLAYAQQSPEPLKSILIDVVGTPVSPELLPPKDDQISQVTEDIIGAYELHDFFLWHIMQNGSSAKKILRLAESAFEGYFDRETIRQTLIKFLRRFFSQQFKRSCMPDGPKVTQVSLSPRGDLRMPSDACGALWLKEIENPEE
ncbi:MAG: NAD(+) synthase [Clostridia bacterium]|nr:NAD(+) synthase [Clostridia bacterium]